MKPSLKKAVEQTFDETAREGAGAPRESVPAAHQPFTLLPHGAESNPYMQLAERTFDVCRGIELCIQLVHSSNLTRLCNVDADPGAESAPTLDSADTERLVLFAKSAAGMLAQIAEGHIERFEETPRSINKGGARNA